MWWNEEFMVISAVQCKYDEDSDTILKDYVTKSHFTGEQLLHLIADGHMAFYDEKRDGEKLDRYLQKSRAAGLRQILYLNVHCALEAVFAKHPDYMQVDRIGQYMKAYDIWYWLCVNSPWFDAYIESIKQLCSHDIDGIFLDGPVMLSDGCFCPSCLKKFEQAYKKSRFDATFQEHVKFNVDSVTEFVKKTYQAVKAINPNILLYINNNVLAPYAAGSSARDTEPYVDMIGTEGGFVWLKKDTPLWHLSAPVKMAETISRGKPVVCFTAGDHKPWSYYMHTASETAILYAQMLAHGANIWYGIHGPTAQMDTPGGKAAIAFNAFIETNKQYFIHTKTKARVALMWSDSSANNYAASVNDSDFVKKQSFGADKEKKGDHYRAFMGFYDVLTRGHIQFDLLDEVGIREGMLTAYDVLILPTCACLTEDVADCIRSYVAHGGRLISSFDSGLYNMAGNMNKRSAIADIQGVAGIEGVVTYKDGCGYQVTAKESFATHGLSYHIVPSTTLAVKTTPAAEAIVLAEFTVPMDGRYEAMPKPDFPALLYHRFGDGESLYMAGAVGEFVYEYGNVDYKRMILNAVRRFSKPLVVTDAPETVEMVLRQQGDVYLLHLVNLTGEMTRPIERIIPLRDIQIQINLGRSFDSVSTLCGSLPIEWQNTEQGCTLCLPILNQYEVIVIK